MSIILAACALLALSGCEPYYVGSVNGLIGPYERAEPFDPKFVGEWYGPNWEAVEWKVERLVESDNYFITHFGNKGKRSFFTACVVKAGDLKLMDLREASAKGQPAGPHLLMKIDRRLQTGLWFGAPPPDQVRKFAALGGGPVIRCKLLTLQPLRNRYFLDHPGLVATQKTFDGEGRSSGLTLTATSKELRDFFVAHGGDEGLWADDERAIKMEGKLNPGDK